MLVCLREVDKSELAKRHIKRIPAPHYERYYSLYTSESNATIVDVVDSRARKTINFDVALHSPSDVQAQVVEPLLMTVLAPNRASQAVVVVDGTSGNRYTTLMDAAEGVLAHTARTAAAHPDVASLSFSAVTLEDNNTLTDILLPDGGGGEGGEVTILEDTEEQFTAVEDAHYISLDSERTWATALQRVQHAFAEYKHHVFSFIFSFHASTGRPNTTMQFVSFTVNEVARGMKSSRHAVSSAAGLIECSSPTLTFTSTKLLYLLKPSLLGQQPGAWIACFSPVSVLEAAERETFQEGFAVAQTASRLYSSRIALLSASTAMLPPPPSTPPSPSPRDAAAAVEDREDSDMVPGRTPARAAPSPSPSSSAIHPPPPLPPRYTHAAQTEPSSTHDSSADVGDAPSSLSHLVQTPAGAGQRRRAEAGTSTPTAYAQAPPPQSLPAQGRRLVGVTAAVQTDAVPQPHPPAPAPAPASSPSLAAHTRESIQRAASEESSAVRFEFDTYRTVMERAMAKLRADMREYADQLAATKEEMRAQRRQARELRRELEMADESRHATVLENSELRETLAGQQRAYEQRLQELSTTSALRPPPSPPGQLTRQEESNATRALREEVELLEVRVSELTELVAFHQTEIKAHVTKEHGYRQRILDLEAALRAKEREVIASRAAAQEARRASADAAAEVVVAQSPPVLPAAAGTEVQRSHSSNSNSSSTAVLREDLRGVEDRAAEVECHLRCAVDELQRERTQRLQLENLLRRREKEEVVASRTAEETTGALVSNLQHAYETQLRDLRAEMTGFREQLARQVPRASPAPPPQSTSPPPPPPPPAAASMASNDSSLLAQQPPRRATPLHMSPVPEAAAKDSAAVSSQRGSARPSPARPSRRTQSFEEYMKEEPHYELHRASFLRPRTRAAGADASGVDMQ